MLKKVCIIYNYLVYIFLNVLLLVYDPKFWNVFTSLFSITIIICVLVGVVAVIIVFTVKQRSCANKIWSLFKSKSLLLTISRQFYWV